MSNRKRVLFVCIENSCRSQMAEAFAHLEAANLIQADSAGSRPSGRVNPKAVAVMAELGYDLSKHRSKSLSDLPQIRYDYVITMGCGDECPFIPADHHEDWNLPDPKDMPLDGVRQVREEIRARVAGLARRI
jgi:arsenate reductase